MFLLDVLLALAWVALTGEFTLGNLIIGLVLGYVMLWLMQRTLGPLHYFQLTRRLPAFVLFFVWELILANLQVAYAVLSPRQTLRPGIVAVPLDARTDSEITLLANLITLTPGTLSLDISTDRRVLYVHTMHLEDADGFRRNIKEGFERRLLEVFR
ncbi:MAG: Na+/H+ antiporter subunit E [Anaerolineaceae bacterium]|jgi:multicomponent Na+:H+ antiporter subunit E|nr:Na+/H+ antiporter subunit E [Anaerolineae bacterium]MDD5779155.1 Na+/H+ antiporter subunit E [Candidatus Thermoplasmatota archaeon]MDX9831960.1 Na+/H+ antiporter subunit E [Anaerolineae bacterium]NLF14461.1 Na+/H+ antiporter subunit E [Anaerolineaceae bacterium]